MTKPREVFFGSSRRSVGRLLIGLRITYSYYYGYVLLFFPRIWRRDPAKRLMFSGHRIWLSGIWFKSCRSLVTLSVVLSAGGVCSVGDAVPSLERLDWLDKYARIPRRTFHDVLETT